MRSASPALVDVPIQARSIEAFETVLGASAIAAVVRRRERAREALDGRGVWCVNTTAAGGGVAQMLRSSVAYARGAGVDVRCVVVPATPAFFPATEQLHYRRHGFDLHRR